MTAAVVTTPPIPVPLEGASPTVSTVLAGIGPQVINSGDELISSMTSLSVVFSEHLNTASGGANSVTNLSNWQLTRYGVDVSHQMTGITFGVNAITGQYAAVITFSQPLTQGGYQLVARHTIEDLGGHALNGGTDFTRNFWVADVLAAGPPPLSITNKLFDQFPSVADGRGRRLHRRLIEYVGGVESGNPRLSRYNSAGIAQGAEFVVSSDSSAGTASVAMDAMGDFVVTWASNSGIYAQRYNSAAVKQGSRVQGQSRHRDFCGPACGDGCSRRLRNHLAGW